MHRTLLTYLAITLMLFSVSAYSAEITPEKVAIVTLEDGTKIQINDDFTWEYVFLESQTPTNNLEATSVATSASVIATTEQNSATAPVVADTLTASAMKQATLLKSTAKNGVKVSFLDSQWDDKNRLGLTFELSSNSPEHYVVIELEIGLFSDSGSLIKKETVKVWKAIFRMPESYLRKGQVRESRVFWIDGIDKQQWNKQLMTLKVTEMDSRM
ncbi:DUF3157 family protein [Shewanella colwelliana]|uniref:DUF3157 domain-containing protein n=1 Tax=Shewanella colwelliana TaxID=23 RepID=A0ABQ4PBB3_SHECO|nr:DUF3157 family protein [Shewanella colwelliana]MDX1282828.1 DUF3157 family protein [Shewanella colwelliana]GIU44728.1 hypothetical protein TUM3794_33380 [Shewanella colwelliana]